MNPTKAQLETIARYKALGFTEVECTHKCVTMQYARGQVTKVVRIQKNGKAVREVAHV